METFFFLFLFLVQIEFFVQEYHLHGTAFKDHLETAMGTKCSSQLLTGAVCQESIAFGFQSISECNLKCEFILGPV